MKFLIFILFSNIVFSRTLEITHGITQLVLTTSDTTINYKDENTDLTLTKTACNEKIFESAMEQIEHELKPAFKGINTTDSVRFKIDNNKFYESVHTARVKFFLNYAEQIKSLKIQNSLKCKE